MSEEKQALLASLVNVGAALNEKIDYLKEKVRDIEGDIEVIEKGTFFLGTLWIKHGSMRISRSNLGAAKQMLEFEKESENEKIKELEAIKSELDKIGDTVNRLQTIKELKTVPRGIKTTWSYDICHFLSKTILHKFFLKIYDFRPPNRASYGQLVIFMILILALGAALFFGWPLAVAAAGAMLLSIALDAATRYVKNYRDRDVIDFDNDTLEAYKNALKAFSKEPDLSKPGIEEGLGDDSIRSKSLISQTNPKYWETHHIINPKNLLERQKNYAALRALSSITFRLEQCSGAENICALVNKLEIKNKSGTEDQTYLIYLVEIKNFPELETLKTALTHLFPDVEDICKVDEIEGESALVISHKKVVAMLVADEFDEEEFMERMSAAKKQGTLSL